MGSILILWIHQSNLEMKSSNLCHLPTAFSWTQESTKEQTLILEFSLNEVTWMIF